MSTDLSGGTAANARARKTTRLTLKMGASLAALLASPALADCVPTNTSSGTSVVCTGNDPDGIVVSAIYASVTVTPGAIVDNIVATNVPNSLNPSGSALIDVAGTLTNGLVIDSGTSAIFYIPPTEDVALTVAETGQIKGATPILLRTQPGSFFARASATIINNGEIRTTVGAGPAIVTADPGASINTLTNSSTGSIVGGIQADVGAIYNQGLIDGLTNAALTPGSGFSPGGPLVLNTGIIRNSSGTATIRSANPGSSPNITNSGLISNTGTGAAIQVPSRVDNLLGGVISSANNTAIVGGFNLVVRNEGTITGVPDAITAQSLNLVNAGTINGNVRGGLLGNQVELRGGSTINGGLFLGSGNDILIVSNSGGGLASLISGVIDGGGGFDTLIYRFDTGVTNLSAPLAQLAGFQPTGTLEIINGATVNLVSGFASPGTLTLDSRGGGGSFNNQTTLTSLGTAIVGRGNLNFTNSGSITATLAGPTDFALSFENSSAVTNLGTITAIGGGGFSLNSGSFANQGSITADYTAVEAPITSVTNSGMIRSNQGTGVRTSSAINSGTIFGQQVALSSSYSVTNTGTISSPHIGIEVREVGFIDNQVGGTISGGDYAIKVVRSGNFGTFVILTNAGRIIGNVDLTSADPSSTYNFIETRAGSSIMGNLVLGNGNDRLLVDLGASGPLAGVTGSIIGGPDSSLAYVVRQNTTSTFAPLVSAPSLFAAVGFELRGGATLKLNGPAANNTAFAVGGEGTLDLNANITTNGLRSIVTDTSGAVNIITRGILTGIHTDSTKEPAAMIASSYSFGFPPTTITNLGTVIVRERAPSASGALLAGFAGPGQIVNNGLILVDGGIGVLLDGPYGYGSVINNGTIGQFSGGAGGIGIVNYTQATNNGTISTSKIGVLNLGSLTNNGTISNAGIAVQMGLAGFDGGTLNNYGLIQSSKGAAVVGKSDGYGSSFVLNYATGTIKGKDGGPAMTFAGTAHISNEGAIVGDVLIGQSFVPGQSYPNSSFGSLGGSVRGNVQFGLSDDFFYYVGGLVSGFVDGGAGYDGITLDMQGQTTTNFDLRQYRNFEFFDLVGGGAYTLRNSSAWLGVSVGLSKLIVPATFSLNSSQSFYVNGGWAQIDGTLKTGFYFSSGGILSGSGTVEAPAIVQSGGFVVPGTSGTIGRLTFKGDVGLDGDAAVLIDVGTGDSDRLVVKATPTSAGYLQLGGNGGVSLNLAAVGTGPRFGKVYTIATADGGISSAFSSVQGSFGVLTPVLTYNPKDITLTFAAGSLAAQLPATATPTELAFATALDQLRSGSYSNLSNLYGGVDLLDPRSLGLTLRGLAPTGLGETMALGREQNALITNLVTDRFSLLGTTPTRGGTLTVLGSADGRPHAERFNGSRSGSIQSSFAPHLAPERVIDSRLPDGVSGFVSMGFASGRSSLADAAPGQASGRRNWHYAMGLETRLGDATTLGSAVGYVEGESQVLGNRTDVRTSQAVVYGNRLIGPRGYVAGLASLSYNRFGVLRSASDSASLQHLQSSTTAVSAELRAEAGLNFAVAGGLTLTPRAGLRMANMRVGALRETGGELALRIEGLHDQRLEASAGVKLAGSLPLRGGWRFSPSLQADLVQRAAGSGGTVSVRFDAADALAFALPLGAQPARWIAAKGGVQLTNRGLALAVGFETDAPRDGVRNDSAFAAVSLAF